MKALTVALLLTFTVGTVRAEDLSQADREALLEKVEAIREDAVSKVDARLRTAISAYKAAVTSDSAALELYLKCEEMLNFEEMKKSSGDFRNWKKNDEKLSLSEFKLALRYQLRWLLLTLQSASEDPDPVFLAAEASRILDSVVAQAEDLRPVKAVLEQSVTATVFARAYKINGIKVEGWPLSPAQLDPIYDQILLPPLRNPERLADLRATWTKRMIQEGILADMWSGKVEEKKKSGVRSPQYEKFIEDKLPDMQWEAEVDLFRAGDERDGALRMIEHIEKHIAHKSAPKWAAEFTTLLQGEPEAFPEPEPTADPAGNANATPERPEN